MKLIENVVDVQTNMTFDETVAMGIGYDAVPMIIERLISAYSNPYRAVLREYTSNAYDAHVAVGQTAPIEVSMPNGLSPVLRVQDFGPGLDREELKGFGQFGTSSKRDSNDYTGGFGIGSKVGLAVSSQFTVVSVKNGRRNTVVVARDAANRPNMNFLAESETDEPNSTTIIVPINNPQLFGDLTDFFVGWKPGTILIDGDAPKRSVHNEMQFRLARGGIAWNDLSNISSGRDHLRVLINQVYYTLDYRKLGLSFNQRERLKYYIVKLDNGSVTMHSSREELVYDARTKASIKERMDQVLTLAGAAMAVQFENSANLHEALRLRSRMATEGFPVEGLRYQGRAVVLPGDVIRGNTVPDTAGTWAMPALSHRSKSGWQVDKSEGGLSKKNIWQRDPSLHRFVIVHSAGPATLYQSSRNRTRVMHREAFGVGEWLSAQDNASHYSWDVFITSEKPERINRVYRGLAQVFIDAEEFNATVKDVRATLAQGAKDEAAAKRNQAVLRVFIGIHGGSPAVCDMSVTDIKSDYNYAVILRNQSSDPIANRIRAALTTRVNYSADVARSAIGLMQTNKVAVILVGKTEKIDDLIPLLPTITTFEDLAVSDILSGNQTATKYDLMAVRDRSDHGLYAIRDMGDTWIDQVKRKETAQWLRALREYRQPTSTPSAVHRWMAGASDKVNTAITSGQTSTSVLDPSPVKRYPLLSGLSYSVSHKDIVQYINVIDSVSKA